MTQEQDTTKRKSFKHLTEEKRGQIEILLKFKIPKSRIAEMVGIARSTLYREIERGMVQQMDSELRIYRRYFADAGQRVYESRRQNSRPPLKLMKAHAFIAYAEDQILRNKQTPDPICGKARRCHLYDEMVCAKTLYNYIDQGLLKVRNIDLPVRVKRKAKQEKKRKRRRAYGMSIGERPISADAREDFGHWEIDTVIGKAENASVLLTLDERKTRYRHIVKIRGRTAKAVGEGLRQIQQQYGENFQKVFRSITSDNGSEFSDLPAQLPGVPVYYAHPYSSFERGTNERQNELIRRFIPKGRSLDGVSPDAVQRVQNWINALPRKIFHYASADELFSTVLFDIAI